MVGGVLVIIRSVVKLPTENEKPRNFQILADKKLQG